MSFIKIIDEQGGERYFSTANISTVEFNHRNRDIRETITVTLTSGHSFTLTKDHGPLLRAALDAEAFGQPKPVVVEQSEPRPTY